MPSAIQSEAFWRDVFAFTPSDEAELQDYFLLQNKTLSTNEIVRLVMEWRLLSHKTGKETGDDVYYPTRGYAVGQKLTFSELDDMVGEVRTIRDGNNARYGTFRVMEVYFSKNDRTLEFAMEFSKFDTPFYEEHNEPELSTDELYARYGELATTVVKEGLERSPQFVNIASQWLPTFMLVSFHEGHLNLADAMIDIMAVPVGTAELLMELPVEETAAQPIKVFSLHLALSQSPKFKNIGTVEQPLWYLMRLG